MKNTAYALVESCPRFDRCSAPVCPLDPKWRQVPHCSGERVCLYLLEWGKSGGPGIVRGPLPGQLSDLVSRAHQELSSLPPRAPFGHNKIRRKLIVAAKSGSRIESGQRLQGKGH